MPSPEDRSEQATEPLNWASLFESYLLHIYIKLAVIAIWARCLTAFVFNTNEYMMIQIKKKKKEKEIQVKAIGHFIVTKRSWMRKTVKKEKAMTHKL